jgi:hypothetical protein
VIIGWVTLALLKIHGVILKLAISSGFFFLYLTFFFNEAQGHVSVFDVDFHQFLDKSWPDVPFPFLVIIEIPSTIQNET